MSNIDKLALPELREMFEAWWEVNYHNGNPPRFGWAAWRDGDGYKIDDDEPELDGMWQAWQAAHSGKLEAAEKRIAELEAVKFKLSDSKLLSLAKDIVDNLVDTGASEPEYTQQYIDWTCKRIRAAVTGKGE